MKRSGVIWGIVSLLVIVSLGTLTLKALTRPQPGIHVVASIYPLGYFAEALVGDLGTVTTLTPAGAEPHDYEPTAADVATVEHAQLLVLNGGLEAWGDRIRKQLAGGNVRIIVAAQAMTTKNDPHVWLDPVRAQAEAQAIADQLIVLDPTHATTYQQHLTTLDQQLSQLDHAYQTGLEHCQSRDIVTTHEAFAYLADRYNLTQVGLTGLNPDEEPTPVTLASVAQFVRSHNVTTILFETLVSPKLAETIAHETGAKTAELNPIEGLSHADKAAGKDYRTIMQDNLATLQHALGCTP